jgi:hypothetical protein
MFKKYVDYKVFFFGALLSFLSIATCIALFNYSVDSAGAFHKRAYLLDAVRDLVSGRMIAGLSDYDEGEFQRLIVERNMIPDTICIGSSRSMNLRRGHLEKLTFGANYFNHAVSGARIEDCMAIVGLYQARGSLPKTVIFGLDPWVFNGNIVQGRWKSLTPYYLQLHNGIYHRGASIPVENNKYRELLTYEYTITNIKHLFKKNKTYYVVATKDIDDNIVDTDGSHHLPYRQRFQKDEDTQKAARNYFNNPASSYERFSRVANTGVFENFIKHMRDKGVNIVLLLSPYHPLTYKTLTDSPDYRAIRDVETYVKEYAKKNGLRLLGSYDPVKYGFESKDFFDATHGHDVVSEIIFKEARNSAH